ncbi:MAG: hypothetical protein ABIB47_04875 [Candidatus Woesearchaeota archaeon]
MKKRQVKKVYREEESFHTGVVKGIARELAPDLVALIIFLIIAQALFFLLGPNVLIPNITGAGLFLLNLIFAIIVPYTLAMVVKAIRLIILEVKKTKERR